MNRRAVTPLVLASLLIGMGAWIYFYEIKGEADREAAEAAAKKVLPVEADAVTAVKITNRYGSFDFKKDGDAWRVTAPADVPADKEVIEDIVRAAADFEASRTLTDAASRLSAFGLDTPRASLTLTTASGDVTLAFGSDAPFQSQYYVRKEGATDVLIVADPLRGLLDKDLSGFRDRALLSAESRDVSGLTITGPELAGLVARKDGVAWKAAGNGVSFRLKKRSLDDLLYDLTQVQAAEFVDDATVAATDLATPVMSVTLEITPSTGGSPRTETLTVGPAQGEGEARVYPVRREVNGSVVRVKAESIDALRVTADELRDRSPVAIDRWQTDRVVAVVDGVTMTASKDGFDWKVEPQDATWKAQDVTKLMDLLGAAEAETFVGADDLAQWGLDKPRLTLTFSAPEGGGEQRVRLSTGPSGKTYAQTDGDPTVYQLSESVMADLVGVLKPAPAPAPATGEP